jgi:hypothetical protein
MRSEETLKPQKYKTVKAWVCMYPNKQIARARMWKGLMGVFATKKDCNEMGFEGVHVQIRIPIR